MKKDNSYAHILKYTGIFGSVQGFNILAGVVRNKFTALFLGPSGMGLLSLFNSASTFLSSACNLGIPTSGVKVIADRLEDANDSEDCSETGASEETIGSGGVDESLPGEKGVGGVAEVTVSQAVEESVCLVRSFSALAATLGALLCALLGPLFNVFAFSWGNHTLHFVLLAPTVFFTILAGGELSVLKALGKLKALAMQASALALLSLFFSVPVYWKLGEKGILAVLFFIAFSQWLLNFRYSRRAVGFRLEFSKKELLTGAPLVRLGVSFVLAGMVNSGAELLVRAFLNTQGDLEMVGLFNAGVTIVIVYAGVVFSVMESDYYPRLSAVSGTRLDAQVIERRNVIVNRQLEVNVLLMGPIAVVVILALPIGIPLLYDSKFLGMLAMTQVASASMLFKAVYLPIEYLPLSRGESKIFLAQECFCVVLLVLCEMAGYVLGGLTGLGAGIVVAYGVETLAVLVFSRLYYRFSLSSRGRYAILVHLVAVLLVLGVATIDYHRFLYWLLGGLVLLASVAYSMCLVRKSIKAGSENTAHSNDKIVG